MKSPNNISPISGFCYGCGVCGIVCPTEAISIKENKQGFYSPVIDEQKCIHCGKCLKTCAYSNKFDFKQEEIAAFSGYSNNSNIQNWCSSGGVAYELARDAILNGMLVCNVKYDVATQRALHYISKDIDALVPSVGSKYLPSLTFQAFSQLDFSKKNLIVGTPCQIASLRLFAKLKKVEDNLILVDFFCHGVPSLLLWDKYISEIPDYKNLKFISWRNKTDGWHDSWGINADYCHPTYDLENQEPIHKIHSQWTKGDMFYEFFLGNFCMNSCCYDNCPFKGKNSLADIRLGDFWGDKFSANEYGVNAVLAYTGRGKRAIEGLSERCHFEEASVYEILQAQMTHSLKKPWIRHILLREFHTKKSLNQIFSRYILTLYYGSLIPARLYNRIKKLL